MNQTTIEKLVSWIGSVSSLAVHSTAFGGALLIAVFHLASWEVVLLVLTTIVSLEAVYLAIFIQMTVNRNTESLHEVEEDVGEIQGDIEELEEDVDEIQEGLEEMSEDVEGIQEDIEEITEDERNEEIREREQKVILEKLTSDVRRILADLERLREHT